MERMDNVYAVCRSFTKKGEKKTSVFNVFKTLDEAEKYVSGITSNKTCTSNLYPGDFYILEYNLPAIPKRRIECNS